MLGTLASASAISAPEGWSLDAVVVVGTGIALSFSMWWAYFLVPHAPVLAAHLSKASPWGYGNMAIYAINAWLVSGFIAIGASLLGAPLWACLLLVLFSPALIIVFFELGAWRRLDETLERAVGSQAPHQ